MGWPLAMLARHRWSSLARLQGTLEGGDGVVCESAGVRRTRQRGPLTAGHVARGAEARTPEHWPRGKAVREGEQRAEGARWRRGLVKEQRTERGEDRRGERRRRGKRRRGEKKGELRTKKSGKLGATEADGASCGWLGPCWGDRTGGFTASDVPASIMGRGRQDTNSGLDLAANTPASGRRAPRPCAFASRRRLQPGRLAPCIAREVCAAGARNGLRAAVPPRPRSAPPCKQIRRPSLSWHPFCSAEVRAKPRSRPAGRSHCRRARVTPTGAAEPLACTRRGPGRSRSAVAQAASSPGLSGGTHAA